MSNKGIRIYLSEWTAKEYAEGVERGDLSTAYAATSMYYIDSHSDDFGEWNDDETEWVPATDVVTAFHLLSGSVASFWAQESSESLAEASVHGWYEDEYTHGHPGYVIHKSAHLVGEWTDAEAAEIHKLVMKR